MRTSSNHNPLMLSLVMTFMALVSVGSAKASILAAESFKASSFDCITDIITDPIGDTFTDAVTETSTDTNSDSLSNHLSDHLTESIPDSISNSTSETIPEDVVVTEVESTLVESEVMPSVESDRHKRISLYSLPYSMTASDPNWKRLWINTGALFAAGIVTVGVLECLPENATAWNKEDRRPLFRRWIDHVTSGPVVDHDKAIFNYILHPYGGAAYYMSARSLGFNVLQSFIYSTAVSTLFWEYGIEGFMEIPSIEDIFITPVVGSALGECFYVLKRHIVQNGYTLAGSPVLGYVVAFLVDPVNEFIGYIAGNEAHGLYKRHHKVDYSCSPLLTNDFKGFALSLTF